MLGRSETSPPPLARKNDTTRTNLRHESTPLRERERTAADAAKCRSSVIPVATLIALEYLAAEAWVECTGATLRMKGDRIARGPCALSRGNPAGMRARGAVSDGTR